MKKRILSILLTLVMVIVMLPTVALAAEPATGTADFTTNPTEALALLNAAKTGTADSTWEGNTLTLNGVNFTTTNPIAVKLPAGATIVLNGENTIKGGNSDSEYCYGISGEGDLTISGTGTLNVTGGNTTGLIYNSYGIWVDNGNVTITGGTVNATGGTTNGRFSYSYGIYADTNVEISGGTVNANGGTANGNDGESRGIYANMNLEISGGTVNATGGTANGNDSYGIYADVNFVISGGKVKATGGTADECSYGIWASNDVTISGGSLTAKAGSVPTAAALNKQPTLPAAYSWRTSDSNDYSEFPGTAYEWSQSDAYLELTVVPTYTVTFDANGGSAVTAQSIEAGQKATRPADPTKANYAFAGWYSDSGLTQAFDFNTPISTDITLYAKWNEIINSVTATVTAPVGGEHPSFTVTVPDGAHYTAVVDTWYDLNNNGAHLTNSDTFVTDNEYQARIHFTANTGYEIANGASYTINDTPNYAAFDTAKQRGMNFVATAPAVTTYPLYIAGTQVTSDNASNVLGDSNNIHAVVYDAESNTLTLNSAAISCTYDSRAEQNKAVCYTGEDAFTIRATGTNSLTGGDSYYGWGSGQTAFHLNPAGIYCKAPLTVQLENNAALTVTGGSNGNVSHYGIWALNSLSFKGSGKLSINSGTGSNGSFCGVFFDGDLSLDGSLSVDITSESVALGRQASWSILAPNWTGTLTAAGKNSSVSYVWEGTLTCSDGEITAYTAVDGTEGTVLLDEIQILKTLNESYKKLVIKPYVVPASYKATLDPKEGTVSPAETTVSYHGTYNLPTPVRNGYLFDGWYASDYMTQNYVEAISYSNDRMLRLSPFSSASADKIPNGSIIVFDVGFTDAAPFSVDVNDKAVDGSCYTIDGNRITGRIVMDENLQYSYYGFLDINCNSTPWNYTVYKFMVFPRDDTKFVNGDTVTIKRPHTLYAGWRTPVKYNLWVAGTQVTSANAADLSVIDGVTGTVSFDATSNTLTLNGATINNSANPYGIYYTGKNLLTVSLSGENTITSADIPAGSSYTTVSGFNSSRGPVVFTGSGSLTVRAGNSTAASYGTSYGISVNGKATIASGTTITATAGDAKNDSFGFSSGGLEVSGKLTATGGAVNGSASIVSSIGIKSYEDVVINGSAQVTATGGTATNTGYYSSGGAMSDGINVLRQYYTPTLTIGGTAKVTATAGNATKDGNGNGSSRGIFAADVTVNDTATVTAVGGQAANSAYGIQCQLADGHNININGGTVTVTGVTALSKAPVLGAGVTAGGSASYDGSGAVEYNANDNDTYKWFQAPFTVPVTTYTVTFDANGGSVTPANTTTEATGKLTTLPTPTRSGSYTFKGWYTASSGGTQVTVDKVYTENTTIYAQWNYTGSTGGGGGVSKYTIKFETNGGTTIANKSVKRNAKLAEPTAPTKDGFKFDGWYTDKELKTAYDFDTKVTKRFTLYAKWTEIEKEPENEPDNTDKHNCPSEAFDDLDVNAWYHEDIDYALDNGIFKGVTEKEFAPNNNLTRAMMVTVLYRAEGEPAVNRSIPFADVDMGAYFTNAVIWGQQNGIIKGYSETEFGPDDKITREQIAAIMYRYAQYKGYDVSVGENTNILSYDDFDSISEYAIPSMQWAVGSGLMKGKTTSTLNPLDNATRAEIAAILHRFIEANK